MTQIMRLASCVLFVLTTACAVTPPAGLLGVYRFEDGRIVSIRRSLDKTLRYRIYETGESKRLYRDERLHYVAGGFTKKTPVELWVTFNLDGAGVATEMRFERAGGPIEKAVRIGRQEEVRFSSDGAEFLGRLDLPDGNGPFPAIVMVHGSGKSPATQFMYNGDFLAAHGIASLTFDKRGTGGSTGKYTFDFYQLARDVVAAVDYLKTRSDIETDRIGLAGYSQGGWVAPLAATISDDVRFVLVSYGLIASPAEEARVETRNTLRKRGVEEGALVELDELTLAAVAIVASGFRFGWEQFQSVKYKYRNAPWRKQLSGTVVGDFVKYPKWLIKILGPRRAPNGLPWYYDSIGALDTLDIPMAWFIAGDDESAPPELTVPLLEEIIAAGKAYEMFVFDHTDHGMLLFREENGRRIYTGYDPEYYRREVSSARRLSGLATPRSKSAND